MLFENQPFIDKVNWSALPDEQPESIVRAARNYLLSASDWTQLPDSPLTESKRAEWATYRQALRDILETYAENLLDVEFPVSPDQTA